jgi:hypothetical protein
MLFTTRRCRVVKWFVPVAKIRYLMLFQNTVCDSFEIRKVKEYSYVSKRSH